MTVDQLIATLQALPPEQRALPVVVQYPDDDGGDSWTWQDLFAVEGCRDEVRLFA